MLTRRHFILQSAAIGLSAATVSADQSETSPTASGATCATDSAEAVAARIIDDAWTELQRDLYVQLRMGTEPTRLPNLSLEEAQRRSAVGRGLLDRLDTLDANRLSHDVALTLRLVRFRAHAWSREPEWYSTVVQPYGRAGFFGMFLPTPYCGGYLLQLVHEQLSSVTFRESSDVDRYFALLEDYARIIDQFARRTSAQAAQGMRMPKQQLPPARAMLSSYRSSVSAALTVAQDRLATVGTKHFSEKVQHYIATSILPAFDRTIAVLSDDYLRRAPDTVGIHQYRNGGDIYAELVKIHTTLDLTPEQVHSRGLARMNEIEEAVNEIEGGLQFKADAKQDRWRVDNIPDLTRIFRSYLDRLEPELHRSFASLPKAPYSVRPLPESLRSGMTFGNYDPPRRNRNEGVFQFNPTYLMKQPLWHLAALIYHELMPGHHLQRASQLENLDLHPFRRYSFINAYDEGWAEYAASIFADEAGLYQQREERYGRLTFDAFATSRLVVDTGMNALGWSLERAREYMTNHSNRPEAEISSEARRYSCDLPAQSLPYKLADRYLHDSRERMRRALGGKFSLRAFHGAVIGAGSLPLTDLDWHVNHETQQIESGLKAP